MEQLIHADIFFFVTTIAITVLSVATLVALIYLIIILRNFKELSTRAKEEGLSILEDVTSVRHFVKEKTHTLASLFGLFTFLHRKRHRSKMKVKSDL